MFLSRRVGYHGCEDEDFGIYFGIKIVSSATGVVTSFVRRAELSRQSTMSIVEVL